MQVELQDIRDFLAGCVPFTHLPGVTLDDLPRQLHIQYLRRGSLFPPSAAATVYIVRQGAIDIRDSSERLVEKLAEGSIYIQSCSDADDLINTHGVVAEDCLVYTLDCDALLQLRKQHPEIDHYFKTSLHERLQYAMSTQQQADSNLHLHSRVADILRHAPITATASISIQEAAAVMAEQQVSSLLITDGGRLSGIITDRDLRNRCLARGLTPETAVARIMSVADKTITPDTTVIEAQLLMSQHNLHHLPVLDNNSLVGMVSSTDLSRLHGSSPMHLISSINKAETVDELVRHSKKLPEQQQQLISSGATAKQTSFLISTIADKLTSQLFNLAEAKLGPAPVAYSWFAIGSLGRQELTSHSDQDNALILADDYDASQHADYFENLAKFVSDALDACGFYYCPGDVMATNPEWRKPLRNWLACFTKWVDTPEPKALLLACNFFDMRLIQGDETLFTTLQQHAVQHARKNTVFHAYLAGNAMQQHPPLGFFRQFLLIHDGEHDDTFDLKLRGLLPITDLARLFSLVEGVTAVNTFERIRAVAGSPSLSKEGADNLYDALELISTLRLQHQVDQFVHGESMDNFVNPRKLSGIQRGHLKDVFAAIRAVQETVSLRYQANRF
jgi:CBS domain-containing protein